MICKENILEVCKYNLTQLGAALFKMNVCIRKEDV